MRQKKIFDEKEEGKDRRNVRKIKKNFEIGDLGATNDQSEVSADSKVETIVDMQRMNYKDEGRYCMYSVI